MSDSVLAVPRLEDPGEIRSPTQERVAGLRGSVHPDGGAVSFAVQFTNQRPFKVLVPFLEMPAILHEFRAASESMINRQALTFDRGASAMLELARSAMRPAQIEGMVDRRTGDRVYMMQFDEHAPMAVRLSITQALDLRAQMDRLQRALAH